MLLHSDVVLAGTINPPVTTSIHRFKTLTENCLWARCVDSQVAGQGRDRVGVINRMADLARPQSVRFA